MTAKMKSFIKQLTASVTVPVIAFGGIFLGEKIILDLLQSWGHGFFLLSFRLSLALTAVWGFFGASNVICSRIVEAASRTASEIDDYLAPLSNAGLKVLSVLSVAYVFLNLYGYDLTGILAGLGIGGLALAMSSQDLLKNIFGAVVVMFDQVYKVGDKVKLDGNIGVVDAIKIRSTRLITDDGVEVIVPNSKVSTATVLNYGEKK